MFRPQNEPVSLGIFTFIFMGRSENVGNNYI